MLKILVYTTWQVTRKGKKSAEEVRDVSCSQDMLPFVAVPTTIAQQFGKYRDLFCRAAGFEQVSRYRTGLLLSENKTLQGIAGQWMSEDAVGGRRAMQAAVFEAGWNSSALMSHHRQVIAKAHRGRG
jgi:hypothetical protein